jgi:hypothetical protein
MSRLHYFAHLAELIARGNDRYGGADDCRERRHTLPSGKFRLAWLNDDGAGLIFARPEWLEIFEPWVLA